MPDLPSAQLSPRYSSPSSIKDNSPTPGLHWLCSSASALCSLPSALSQDPSPPVGSPTSAITLPSSLCLSTLPAASRRLSRGRLALAHAPQLTPICHPERSEGSLSLCNPAAVTKCCHPERRASARSRRARPLILTLKCHRHDT